MIDSLKNITDAQYNGINWIELLTALLVIVTATYCLLTYKILRSNENAVREMRAQNESFIRPYIIINTFVTKNAIYYIKIKNTGNSSAEFLELKIDKDFYLDGINNEKGNIKNAYVFNNIVPIFQPGREHFYCLGSGKTLLGKDVNQKLTPQEFTITANYKFINNSYSEKTVINLKQYEGINIYSESIPEHLKSIAKELEEIKNKLNS